MAQGSLKYKIRCVKREGRWEPGVFMFTTPYGRRIGYSEKPLAETIDAAIHIIEQTGRQQPPLVQSDR